jgi:DNA-binding XRE family transcriptional regulator
MTTTAKKLQFYETVGAQIVAMRESAGMSSSQLAALCDVTKSTIDHAEDGYSCSAYLLACIAEALDTTLDALVPIDATDG